MTNTDAHNAQTVLRGLLTYITQHPASRPTERLREAARHLADVTAHVLPDTPHVVDSRDVDDAIDGKALRPELSKEGGA